MINHPGIQSKIQHVYWSVGTEFEGLYYPGNNLATLDDGTQVIVYTFGHNSNLNNQLVADTEVSTHEITHGSDNIQDWQIKQVGGIDYSDLKNSELPEAIASLIPLLLQTVTGEDNHYANLYRSFFYTNSEASVASDQGYSVCIFLLYLINKYNIQIDPLEFQKRYVEARIDIAINNEPFDYTDTVQVLQKMAGFAAPNGNFSSEHALFMESLVNNDIGDTHIGANVLDVLKNGINNMRFTKDTLLIRKYTHPFEEVPHAWGWYVQELPKNLTSLKVNFLDATVQKSEQPDMNATEDLPFDAYKVSVIDKHVGDFAGLKIIIQQEGEPKVLVLEPGQTELDLTQYIDRRFDKVRILVLNDGKFNDPTDTTRIMATFTPNYEVDLPIVSKP